MKEYKLAVVGATGLVGRSVLKVLEEKKLPIKQYSLFASKKSANQVISILGKDYVVQELTEESFVKDCTNSISYICVKHIFFPFFEKTLSFFYQMCYNT